PESNPGHHKDGEKPSGEKKGTEHNARHRHRLSPSNLLPHEAGPEAPRLRLRLLAPAALAADDPPRPRAPRRPP
uniref:Uncharacterized protein n=1 Tax=Aegilops tauschii subsp. strangulata TaxID=200361 RepID=A0A453H5Y7_AEGTS